MSNNGFVFTDHMAVVSNQLWAITSAVGAAMCFLVLLIIGVVSLYPLSRLNLDRVSFRLVRYALIANTIFGIASAVGGWTTRPGFICGFSVFVLQLTLEFSSFIFFCIAFNLQLVIVHHKNGQALEKYYILGSSLLSCALTIPPYAAKQYGWDPLVQDCWYTNDNQKQRLAWQIGTQLIWTGFTVIGEVAASSAVVIYMIRHRIRRRGLIHSINSSARAPSTGAGGRTGSSNSSTRKADHAAMYKNIIMRIALYPIASCIINLTSIMCVVHATETNGIKNINDYNILLLSDFLYGGRAVVYALLAVTDPALVRAMRAFTKRYTKMSAVAPTQSTVTSKLDSVAQLTSVQIELSTMRPELASGGDIEDPPLSSNLKGGNYSGYSVSEGVLPVHDKRDLSTGDLTDQDGIRIVSVDESGALERRAEDLERRAAMEKEERDAFTRRI